MRAGVFRRVGPTVRQSPRGRTVIDAQPRSRRLGEAASASVARDPVPEHARDTVGTDIRRQAECRLATRYGHSWGGSRVSSIVSVNVSASVARCEPGIAFRTKCAIRPVDGMSVSNLMVSLSNSTRETSNFSPSLASTAVILIVLPSATISYSALL